MKVSPPPKGNGIVIWILYVHQIEGQRELPRTEMNLQAMVKHVCEARKPKNYTTRWMSLGFWGIRMKLRLRIELIELSIEWNYREYGFESNSRLEELNCMLRILSGTSSKNYKSRMWIALKRKERRHVHQMVQRLLLNTLGHGCVHLHFHLDLYLHLHHISLSSSRSFATKEKK